MSLVVPDRLEQQAILANGIVGLRTGNPEGPANVARLCGINAASEVGVLATFLFDPTAETLANIMHADRPVRYVVGAVRLLLTVEQYQEPQERMDEFGESDTDYAGEPLEAVHGIDPVQYVAALRASGRARDLRLADSIEAYCDDARKQDVGDADYQQMLDFFDSPRARSIGRRTKRWFVRPRPQVGGGVMAMANWTRTTGTKDDSVWHTGCLHLLEKKSSQRASTGQPI